MRIAHVLAGRGWGGAERLACAVAKGLSDDGFDIAIEATPECAAHARNEGLRCLDEGSESAASDGPAARFRWATDARRRVRAFQPDVVHMHLSTPAFAGAAACVAADFPSLWTFHLLPERSWPLDYMTRLPSAWLVRLAARTGRRTLVGVSEVDAAALRARFDASAVRCVVNAPPPWADENSIGRDAWGGARHALLFVGRLEAQKGLDRFLGALASPLVAAHSFRLLVIGDGPRRRELEDVAAHLGLGDRVVFAGAMPARSAMRAADVVVCPSRFEGMPLVPMEAILSGTAVVASPIAPHRELLASVPESLLPDQEEDWPAWLADRLFDVDRRRAIADRQRPLGARFSIARVIAEYRALYDEIADAADHPPKAAARVGSGSLLPLDQGG
jgi:glycosyltransferase involved in cell wall biosynthesis